jgi:Cu2+-exporting ATPase
MNSLIALGAATSFAAGAACLVVPGLTVDGSLLEEPVMLLAFVLLGRSLEARARANATGER